MATVSWDNASPLSYIRALAGSHPILITFAYTAIDKCDRDFFIKCGACAPLVTIRGAAVAFCVDLVSALQLDVFRKQQPVLAKPALRRNFGFFSSSEEPDGAPPVWHSRAPESKPVFNLPKLQPDATIKPTDSSHAPAQHHGLQPAPNGTPKCELFAVSGIQVCTTVLGTGRYFVHHPVNQAMRNKFIDLVPTLAAAQRRKDCSPPRLALSSVSHALAACVIKFEKPRPGPRPGPGTTVIKLSTPADAYVWTGGVTSASWQKLDDDCGTGLVMQRKNSTVMAMADFQVPDLRPTCVDAHARPTETVAFRALVLDVGECPAYETTMLALATSHVLTAPALR